MSFPAYQTYRDSGIEWLGEVPNHWSPARLRFLAQLNPSRSEVSRFDLDTEVSFVPMEAVGERGGLSLDQTRPIGDVLTGYTYFREGDVSIAKITPCFENGKGAIMRGLSEGVGFGTTELIVVRARPDATTPEFLDWLFRSPAFRTRGEAAMYGAGGQKRVPDDFIRDFMSPGAPLDEQVAIAAFLDREIAKIDALLEEQRRLIALLKEKRQAVVSHAVTKGLDPHAPMKDSGIEWLGEVPAHWNVVPLKRIAAVLAGYAFAANAFSQDRDNWRLLRGINLSASGIRWSEDTAYWQRSEDDGLGEWELRVGDIVLGMDRPWIGDGLRVAKITDDDLPCMLLQRVAAIRAHCPSAQRFILYCLRHEAFFHHCAPEMTGVSVPHISGGQIEEFRMPLPSADEMDGIATHIDNRSRDFAALIKTAQSAIELLGERRIALISAAVTGKIDVRGLAKVLPFPIDRARARGLIATEIIERSAHQATFGRVKLQKIAFLAEAHVGISELEGSYTREAAGPLDRALIDEMESGAHSIAGIKHEQLGGAGTTVIYRLGEQRGAHRQELATCLGAERTAKLDKLIADCASLTTKQAEAVATLHGVWNDTLSEGATPTDDEIIFGFLNDWHPEKREKFRASELLEWLGWMRRHGIVPTGSGPKTATGRLFV